MNAFRLTLLALAVSGTIASNVSIAQSTATTPAAMPAATSKPMAARTGSAMAGQDTKFVNKAGEAGAAEIAMGKLAQDHAASQEVKDFGARMVADHQKASDQLKSIASSKGVTPPDQPSKKDQAQADKMSKMQGADFDKAYVKSQVSAHKDAVSLFKSESKSGKDADLQQFATSTLPTLQDHLQMIQQISKAPMKSTTKSSNAADPARAPKS